MLQFNNSVFETKIQRLNEQLEEMNMKYDESEGSYKVMCEELMLSQQDCEGLTQEKGIRFLIF